MDRDTATEAELIRQTENAISLPKLKLLHEQHEKLSGLFLPSVPSGYRASNKRLLLIGKETRSWIGGKKSVLASEEMSSYLHSSQDAHWKYWANPKAAGKSPFLGFLTRCKEAMVAAQGEPAVIWANLFCISHKNRSPRSSAAFEQVAALSQTMLSAQIELLQPTHILFVTGPSYDRYIKQFFSVADSNVIRPRQLWQFSADQIPAFRTPHPQHATSNDARQAALDHLIGAIGMSADFG